MTEKCTGILLLGNTAAISVRLKPGSKRDSIEIKDDRSVAISITSRPVEGKANEHLIRLLSRILHVSKSSCSIIRGSKSRNKVIAIKGFDKEEVLEKLKKAAVH